MVRSRRWGRLKIPLWVYIKCMRWSVSAAGRLAVVGFCTAIWILHLHFWTPAALLTGIVWPFTASAIRVCVMIALCWSLQIDERCPSNVTTWLPKSAKALFRTFACSRTFRLPAFIQFRIGCVLFVSGCLTSSGTKILIKSRAVAEAGSFSKTPNFLPSTAKSSRSAYCLAVSLSNGSGLK